MPRLGGGRSVTDGPLVPRVRPEPTDLDHTDLAAALAAGWGLEGAELTNVPEGAGSHHWRCRAGSEERFVSVDDLAAATLAAANDPAGGLHLIDWDTAMSAPRERDLQAILGDDDAGWDDYRAVAGAVELDRNALGLYRRMWPLTDIVSYVTTLRRPHEETDDTHLALEVLVEYLG